MNEPVIIDCPDRDSWLAARRHGIGSSEIASILGLGFETPAEVYARKVGEAPDREPSERMELGLALEPYIASRYVRETGLPVQKGPALAAHPDRPWQLASGEYVGSDRLVELKAVFSYPGHPWGEPGTDQIPDHYLLQVTQQAGVFGVDVVDVAALFVGHGFRRYVVPFDPELYWLLSRSGSEFQERVERRQAPAGDWQSAFAGQVQRKIAHVREGLEVALDADAALAVEHYQELGRIAKEAEEQRKAVKEGLLARLGEASRGVLPDGTAVTQKVVKRAGYTVEPCEFLDMRIRKPKPQRTEE